MRLCKVFRGFRPTVLSLAFLIAGPLSPVTPISRHGSSSSAQAQSASVVFPFKIDPTVGPPSNPKAPISIELVDGDQMLDASVAATLKAIPYIQLKAGGNVFFVLNKSGGTSTLQTSEHTRDTDKGIFSLPIYVEPGAGIRGPAVITLRIENFPRGLSDMRLTVRRSDTGPALNVQTLIMSGKPVIVICLQPGCTSAFETRVQALLSDNASPPGNAEKDKSAITDKEKSANTEKEKKVHLYAYDPSNGSSPKGEFTVGVFSASLCDSGGPYSGLKKVSPNGEDFTPQVGDGATPYCIVIADRWSEKFRCFRAPRSIADTTISLPLNDNVLRAYDSCPEPVYTLQVRESGKDKNELRPKIIIGNERADLQGKIRLYNTSTRPSIRIDSEDYEVVPDGTDINPSDHTITVPVRSISIDLDNVRFNFVNDIGKPEKYCDFKLVVPKQAVRPRSPAPASQDAKFDLVFDSQKDRPRFNVKQPNPASKLKLSIPELEKQEARLELASGPCTLGDHSGLGIADLRSGEIKRIVSESKPFVSLVMIPDAKLAKIAPDNSDRAQIWQLILNAFNEAIKDDDSAAWDTIQMSVAQNDGQFVQHTQRSSGEAPFSNGVLSDLNGSLVTNSAIGARQVQIPITASLFQNTAEQAGVSGRPKQVVVLAGHVAEKSSVCDDLARGEVSRYRFITAPPPTNLIILDFLLGDPAPTSFLVPVDAHSRALLKCDLPGRTTASDDVADRILYFAANIPSILQSTFIQREFEQHLARELKNQMTKTRGAWR